MKKINFKIITLVTACLFVLVLIMMAFKQGVATAKVDAVAKGYNDNMLTGFEMAFKTGANSVYFYAVIIIGAILAVLALGSTFLVKCKNLLSNVYTACGVLALTSLGIMLANLRATAYTVSQVNKAMPVYELAINATAASVIEIIALVLIAGITLASAFLVNKKEAK